jgi:small conductance mechanosensitive channel
MQLTESTVLQFALRAGAAFLAFLIGRWLARRAQTSLRIALSKTAVAPSMARLLLLLTYYGILLITAIISLTLLGVPLEAVLSASLIIVVILGIALQQSISNLAATIIFMLFQPFKLGELVKTNDVTGTVKEIQFFSTVLVTGDNLEVTIPNAKIQGDTLLNYTRLGTLRVDFVFNVSYQSNLDKVKRVLHELINADPRVLAEPAPMIFVQALGENSLQIAVRPWVKSDDYWTLQWDLPELVKLRFDAEGISIPYPQRDVHLFQVPPPPQVGPPSSAAAHGA